ncbi:hypothetical protein EST38_g12446 [Candolleomyces aberdarensis]|uniref:Uncharacterized protein n=1 Tax=Candolleomyces aberdarensis TaxID=2316362 RepID=A0A4Q2D365_9AGAR|nr:hypothetical protein EST38_g12446 [Candolleomyces aberdarensis]
MAPKGWTTDAQATFLTSYLTLYDNYAITRRYQPFWDIVNAQYLENWPILPEGISPESLGEDEFKAYSDSLSKLYSRIKDWFRWRRNSRSRNTTHTVTSRQMRDIYASGTRNSKEYEIYVKMYPGIFQPAYEAECTRLSVCGRAKLSIWHKIAREVWEDATDEEKAAVQAQLILDKEANATEEEDPCTPSDYQKFWEKLPAVLSKTVAPPVRKAGVLAFITIVGPVPNAGGQILATTIWKDHDRVLVDQLATFASRYEFPPDVCAKRSLISSQKADDATEGPTQGTTEDAAIGGDGSEGSSGLVSGDVPGSPADASLFSKSSDRPMDTANDLPQTEESAHAASSNISAITAGPSNEISNNANASSFNSSECGGGWMHNPDWADPQVFKTIMRLNAPDMAPTIVPAQSDKFSMINQAARAQNPVPSHVLAPDSDKNIPVTQANLLHHLPIAPLSFHVPVPGTSANLATSGHNLSALQASAATVLASNTSQNLLSALPPFHEPVSNGSGVALAPSAPAPYVIAPASQQVQLPEPGMVTPATTAVSAHVPAASHTDTSARDNLGTSPTAIQIDKSSKEPHDSLPLAGLSTPFTFIPLWPLVNPKQSPPTNENTPPSPKNSLDNRDYTRATSTQTPFQSLDNGIRRSRRAPVPSTHLDRQNEIGTNIVPPKPPADTISVVEEPAWFAPAYQYLKNGALGHVWIDLVEKWAEYERLKGWKSAKGLPAKGRPEEWQQWASKARHGIRDYNCAPTIGDAADIGLAITAWVSSFQSSDFSKTGLHGMVALLTLMVWWGTAALTPSSWNTDSRPQWQALVTDLLCRFDQLLNDISMPKRSRVDDPSDEAYENKRLRADPISF